VSVKASTPNVRSGKFDRFIDFDAAVRDTSNPPRLHQKMADTVNLALFAQ